LKAYAAFDNHTHQAEVHNQHVPPEDIVFSSFFSESSVMYCRHFQPRSKPSVSRIAENAGQHAQDSAGPLKTVVDDWYIIKDVIHKQQRIFVYHSISRILLPGQPASTVESQDLQARTST
jgi:hypothetical protein